MASKLTQEEANMLIEMLKKTVEEHSSQEFPKSSGKLSFDVIGERRTDEFVINIDRKGINAKGCTYQGRIKSNNTILMRLDVNPTSIHENPSTREKIKGSHLHIYSEKYDMQEAIPFDMENKDLYDLCYSFLRNLMLQNHLI